MGSVSKWRRCRDLQYRLAPLELSSSADALRGKMRRIVSPKKTMLYSCLS